MAVSDHLVILLLLVCINSVELSRKNCTNERKNNYGRRFYLSEMRYRANNGKSTLTPIPFYIRIACFEYGYVYITAPGFGLYRQAHRISPSLTEITIRPASNLIKTKITLTGILLESTVDTAMFVLDKTNVTLFAADGMMLIPEDILGQSYIIPSFWKGHGDMRCKVIGTQNSTSVDVTFMANMSNNFYDMFTSPMFYKHTTKSYTLQYLEVLNIHVHDGDPSGTIVESDKQVAVIYEDPSAVINPKFTSTGTLDKTSTQLLPVNQWGTEYIVPPVYPREKYLVRVFAYYNWTSITLGSNKRYWTTVINNGEFKEYILGAEPSLVKGNKPISVYQYSFSSGYVPGGESSMTLVPSLDNLSKGPYTISTMASLAGNRYRTFTNYVSIIIEKQFKDHLIYNGSSLQTVATYMVPDLQNYVVVIAKLNPLATVHILTNSYQSATFGLMVYGISFYVQFGYVGGMSFNGTACGRSPTVTIPATVTTTTLSQTTKAVTTNGKEPPTMTIPATVTTTTLSQTTKAVTTNGKGLHTVTIPATVTTTLSQATKAVTTNGKGPPTMTIPATVTTTTINNTTKAVTTNGKGPRCYSCTHIPHLRYCDTLQQCREGQVCFVERHQSVSGTPYYTAGCTQEKSCQFNQLSPTTTNGQCFSCCRSNFCNNEGCGDRSFSSPRTSGPLCFDCQNFDDPITCDRVTLCSASEVCSIEEHRWGTTEKIYKMGCTPKYTCSSISDHFRRSLPICSSCCDKDYCNNNCTSSMGAGTIFG